METAITLLEKQKKIYVRELNGIKEEAKKNIDRIKQSELVIADFDEAIKKLKPPKK